MMELRIRAESMPEAHAILGRRLKDAIHTVVRRRLVRTRAHDLHVQLETSKHALRCLVFKATDRRTPSAVRLAIADYIASIEAWADGANLGRLLRVPPLCSSTVSIVDVALWLQDDTAGCQTGVFRHRDGSVFLWHTEEDTIGDFDRPRLLTMAVGSDVFGAFLYSYLLPGPAFGWGKNRVLAVDTLSMRRTASGAVPSNVLAWLLWRMAADEDAPCVAKAVAPFADGAAVARVTRTDERVAAEILEVGGPHVVRRRLGLRPRSYDIQVNRVSKPKGALFRLESLTRREDRAYAARMMRTRRHLDMHRDDLNPDQILIMLSSRAGRSWAFCNADVVAHFVAHIQPKSTAVHVGRGPASLGTQFSPRIIDT